jgi:cytochrome b561
MLSLRKPTLAETGFLLTFHALLSGAFIVAYLTGDEDTYRMHVFSGYTVLAALAGRLGVGLFAPAGTPLALPRPRIRPAADWLRRVLSGDAAARCQRSPLLAWMAVVLLAGLSAAAVSGAVADVVVPLEKLHEALAEGMLPLILAHITLVLGLYGLKRLPFPRPNGVPS